MRKRIDEALEAFSAQADQLGTITTQRFAELRDNSESFRGELDSREVAALASIRARFETLRDEMAEADAVTASEREAAMDSLRDRLDTMRRETAEAATAIRDGEAHALTAWRNQIEEMQVRLREAIGEVTRIDDAALDAANSRLTDLFGQAETVDARLIERNRLFAEETGVQGPALNIAALDHDLGLAVAALHTHENAVVGDPGVPDGALGIGDAVLGGLLAP